MNLFERYISKILSHTYLSRREKQAWKEEMLLHLAEASESAIRDGLTPDKASDIAMRNFGKPREVRRRLIRETYGVSPLWYLIVSGVCLVIFILSLFSHMRAYDVVPFTNRLIPTPAWVVFWNGNSLLSMIDIWIGLSIVFFMLIFTRKRIDRVGAFLSLAPFFLVWLIVRITHQYVLSGMMFANWPMIVPFGQPEIAGYLVLFAFCLSLYIWTQNRAVGLAPWIVTIALTTWPILRDTLLAALWHNTNNPVFWGHSYPDSFFLTWAILSILLRFVVLGLYLYGCKKVDSIRLSRSNPA